jgi:hypothetical protein
MQTPLTPDGALRVNYTEMIPMLVAAIQELERNYMPVDVSVQQMALTVMWNLWNVQAMLACNINYSYRGWCNTLSSS